VASGGERLGEAFAGLKVVDFSWVAAGPMTAKALADHGATVIRVESSTRLDVCRRLPPFPDDVLDFDQSWWMANVNSSKLGLSLNLATEEGRALARRLVDWADVVVESYTPGVMQRFGLDYETVSQDHADLVMISTCLLGQTGPQAAYGGFGSHGAAISGFQMLTSWPDRPPLGPSGPYTDVITPRFSVPALAAAILERRRSGLGQHIDLSQVEAAIHFLEPLILDQTVNGRTAQPAGHTSRTAAPHGVYATAGVERYIAIAVETVEQWRALLGVAPLGSFGGAQFDALEARQAVGAEIDATLRDWLASRPGREVEAELIAAGVPAAVCQRMSELHEDPQLAARRFFQVLPHTASGTVTHDGLATHFSAKREMLHSSAPVLGEHTEQVLREILGCGDEEIAGYAAVGALT
jgi:benzylsuccinate CoA-transferase BbsF subunit